jgi:hypothetical protein
MGVAKKMGCRYLLEAMVLYLLDIYPEVGLLDNMVVLFYFLRTLHTIFIRAMLPSSPHY